MIVALRSKQPSGARVRESVFERRLWQSLDPFAEQLWGGMPVAWLVLEGIGTCSIVHLDARAAIFAFALTVDIDRLPVSVCFARPPIHKAPGGTDPIPRRRWKHICQNGTESHRRLIMLWPTGKAHQCKAGG